MTGSRGADGALLRASFPIAAAVAVCLLAVGITGHGLWAPDEPREAQIGLEMLLGGYGPVPRLGGAPFLEKPPLFPWLMATSYAVLGVSAVTARLPAALAGVGSLLVAYGLGRRVGGRLGGLAAALVLATTAGFVARSHTAINDTLLVTFVGGAHLAFLIARDAHRAHRPSHALAVAGLLAGLAFLTKGPIGPVLIGGPVFLAACCLGEWGFARRTAVVGGAWCLAGVVALGGPWVLSLAHAAGWSAVEECLVNNSLGRTFGRSGTGFGAYGHLKPAAYYLHALPATLLPWTLALPALTVWTRRCARGRRAAYLVAVVVAAAVLLSVPAGKRNLYLLPLLPAAAGAVGGWLAHAATDRSRALDRWTVTGLLGLVGLAGGAVAAGGGLALSGADLGSRWEWVAAAGRPLVAALTAVGVALLSFAVPAAVAAARGDRRAPLWLAGALAAAVLVDYALVQPLHDPTADVGPGARRIAALVPDDEPVVGVAVGETVRAIVPYYSGRFVLNRATLREALAELESGAGRHIVLDDDARLRRLRPRLERRFELMETVPIGDSDACVYRLRR